jgi:tetratricopeptide (TPR) repeat protein
MALGDSPDALILSEALLARMPSDLEQEQGSLWVRGRAVRAAALLAGERYDEAIAELDTLISTSGDALGPSLRAQVVLALHNKAIALARLERAAESASVHDDLVRRFGKEALKIFDEQAAHYVNFETRAAQEQAASMLYSKAWVLSDLGRRDEAIDVLDELLVRFTSDPNPVVQRVVGEALTAEESIRRESSERAGPSS